MEGGGHLPLLVEVLQPKPDLTGAPPSSLDDQVPVLALLAGATLHAPEKQVIE